VGVSTRARRALGILGGTFDPVHLGHLAVAEEAREALDLERVIFVPAARPPHKLDVEVSPAEHRAAMLDLAVRDNPDFAISRMELERPGPSYSVDTVAAIAGQSAREGRPEPVFILSAEALEGLPTWREPRRILELSRIAVAPRPGSAVPGRDALAAGFPGLEDRFLVLPGPRLGHASSDIRSRVLSGRSIRYLVPDPVAAYIAQHRLYVTPAG
jgi:nicotinate-nucleotide adenylyltransferase